MMNERVKVEKLEQLFAPKCIIISVTGVSF
jgi:hypothetical protein